MSTIRFQAKANQLTQMRLDEVREALGLETSEKAVLLDELAQIASWVVRQARAGRTIQAVQGGEDTPQVLEHAALSGLKNSVRLELNPNEAAELMTLLSNSNPPSPALQKTLGELDRLAEPFTLDLEHAQEDP